MNAQTPELLVVEYALPWPVSVNHMYKNAASKGRGRGRVLTDEARAYKQEAQYRAKIAMRGLAITSCPVSLTLHLYPPDRRRRDGSNIIKILEDSMTGIVFDDDVQVVHHQVYKMRAHKPGRVELRVRQLMDIHQFMAEGSEHGFSA